MRRIVVVGIILIAISLAVAPFVSAQTWYDSDDRATIAITSMTVDINNITVSADGSVEGTSLDENASDLPIILDEFDDTNTKFCMQADGDAITYNLTVNGVAVVTSQAVANGSWDNTTLNDAITAGVDENDAYIHIELEVNNTDWHIETYAVADDADVRDAWIASNVEITEMDNATASVEGPWVVTDNMTFDLNFNLTDVDIYIDYPGNAVSATTSWSNDSSLEDGDSVLVWYQKYGPVHDVDEDDVTATAGEVIVEFESDDELDDATWEIDFDDDIWDGAFDGIDYDTLEIEINGHAVDENDWEEGSLIIENVDIRDGDNEVIFTWSVTAPSAVAPTAVPPPVSPLEGEYIEGVPNWVLIAIFVVVVLTIIAVYYIEKR